MRYATLIGFALLFLFAQSMVSCRADKNKFVIYTADANIVELTFYERTYSCVALSPKGELCISL